jgi:hypothetical protein
LSEELTDEQISHYRAIALPAPSSEHGQVKIRNSQQSKLLYYIPAPGQQGAVQWSDPARVSTILSELDSIASEQPEALDRQRGASDRFVISNSGRARLELAGTAGFLVLAEKIAHFPGWRAVSDRGPRDLLEANGVASAIWLDGTEGSIDFDYRPAGFIAGLWISISTLAALLIIPTSRPLLNLATRRTSASGTTCP